VQRRRTNKNRRIEPEKTSRRKECKQRNRWDQNQRCHHLRHFKTRYARFSIHSSQLMFEHCVKAILITFALFIHAWINSHVLSYCPAGSLVWASDQDGLIGSRPTCMGWVRPNTQKKKNWEDKFICGSLGLAQPVWAGSDPTHTKKTEKINLFVGPSHFF